MTFEEELKKLEDTKKQMQESFRNNATITIEKTINGEKQTVTYNPESTDYLSNYLEERKSLDNQISRLKLNHEYENRRPLTYHYVNTDGQEGDIEVTADDENRYRRAYEQQLSFIETGVQTTDKIMEEMERNRNIEDEADQIMAEIHRNEQARTAENPVVEETKPNEESKEEPVIEEKGFDFSNLSDEELERRLQEINDEFNYRAQQENGAIEHNDNLLEELQAIQAELANRKAQKEEKEFDFSNLSDEELENRLQEIKAEISYRTHQENGANEHNDNLLEELQAIQTELANRKAQKEEKGFNFSNLSDEELERRLQEINDEFNYRAQQENGANEHNDNLLEELQAIQAELKNRKQKQTQTRERLQNLPRIEETNKATITKPYAIFRSGKDVQIIGDLTVEELAAIDSNILKTASPDAKIHVSRTVAPGKYSHGYPGEVTTIDENGHMEIEGVDEVEYYNNPSKKIDNEPTDVPKTAKKAKKKQPGKTLLSKLKKHWPKILIGAAIIAGAGIALYNLNPDFANAVNNIMSNVGTFFAPKANAAASHPVLADAAQQIKSTINTIQQGGGQDAIINAAGQAQTGASHLANIDWSAIGQGDTVFRDAYNAVSGSGGLTANQWFVGHPLDVFSTATNQFLHLTQEQLNNPEFLKTLATDPNNAILFGNSLQDPSGFMSLSEALGEVAKGGFHI